MRNDWTDYAAAILVSALLSVSTQSFGGETPRMSAAMIQAELEALIKAARAEGELLYCAAAFVGIFYIHKLKACGQPGSRGVVKPEQDSSRRPCPVSQLLHRDVDCSVVARPVCVRSQTESSNHLDLG